MSDIFRLCFYLAVAVIFHLVVVRRSIPNLSVDSHLRDVFSPRVQLSSTLQTLETQLRSTADLLQVNAIEEDRGALMIRVNRIASAISDDVSQATASTISRINSTILSPLRLSSYANPSHGSVYVAQPDQANPRVEYVLPRNEQPAAAPGDASPYRPPQDFDFDNDYATVPVSEIPGPPWVPDKDPLDALSPVERNDGRRGAVVDAFRHSWRAYTRYAMGMDELKPRSRSGKNWNDQAGVHNGMALTLIDGVTTAQLMGLDDEVQTALHYINEQIDFSAVDVDGSVFETNIRVLGSLLSMYELTGEKDRWLIEKATQVANILISAFDTHTGLPHTTVNFKTRRHFAAPWSGGNAILSEIGTMQLELRTLSYHTNNPLYDMKATHLMAVIKAKAPSDFLCPLYMGLHSTRWTTDHVSFGALGDSFYEYILKQYLLTKNTEGVYAEMIVRMLKGISKLLFRSVPSKWLFLAEYRAKTFGFKMDHLACFMGGSLAVAAHELPSLTKEEVQNIMRIAGDLTETCVLMYTRQASGISPEYVEFPGKGDFINGPGYYILRPETFESLFYMYRYTRDEKWRTYGWRMFRAINQSCRVDTGGFVGVREVNMKPGMPRDNLMQSFWLAETLKYAFLLFADESVIDINAWVFNTEAHPLRRRARDPLDVWRKFERDHNGQPAWFPPSLAGVVPIETAIMTAMRRNGTLSGYYPSIEIPPFVDADESLPDDEGLPFDEMVGPMGIRRDEALTDVVLDPSRVFHFL